VRRRAIELKEKQFEDLNRDIEEKEKKREKSFTKFKKTHLQDRKTKTNKWSSRRTEAKYTKDKDIQHLEEESYHSYRKEVGSMKRKQREEARVSLQITFRNDSTE